jgi:hypothetical protein
MSSKFETEHCWYCGVRVIDYKICPPEKIQRRRTIDHLNPRKHGGRIDPKNIVVACVSCNSSKHARPLEEYRRYAFAKTKVGETRLALISALRFKNVLSLEHRASVKAALAYIEAAYPPFEFFGEKTVGTGESRRRVR